MACRELKAVFKEYWNRSLELSPTSATFCGVYKYDDRLDDISYKAEIAYLAFMREIEKKVRKIPVKNLDEQEMISREIMLENFKLGHQFSKYPTRYLAIEQMHGVHLLFCTLSTVHSFKSKKGFANYIKRLKTLPLQLKEVGNHLKRGMKKGWTLPLPIVERVISQLDGFANCESKSSQFFTAAEKHQEKLSKKGWNSIAEKILSVLDSEVKPAFGQLVTFLRTVYKPACRKGIGICHLPEGKDLYALYIKRHTSLDLTGEYIHSLGKKEVRRIQGEMKQVIKKLGFKKNLTDFFKHLRQNPAQHYKSSKQLVTHHRKLLAKLEKKLPNYFEVLPDEKYRVEPMPAYQEKDAPDAYYMRGNAKAGRPGTYYVNTYAPKTRGKYKAEVLAYHEAVPGHHLQITIASQLKNLPEFRKHGGSTAFVEGWALYSEKLAAEMGFYQDPYSAFGRLTFELKRACRLVIDTGIHHYGWSRKRAVKYFKENTSLSEQNIEVEVDRYTIMPGQALSYKIGELFILKLRDTVKKKLGKQFDIRKFHKTLLQNGGLPLSILKKIEFN
ncbi:DUF885 family protein [Candidatus Riflebacteria bacterium]